MLLVPGQLLLQLAHRVIAGKLAAHARLDAAGRRLQEAAVAAEDLALRVGRQVREGLRGVDDEGVWEGEVAEEEGA
jgi:hypothetical protein